MIGELTISSLIPELIHSLNEDAGDYLCEAAREALIKLGEPAQKAIIEQWDALDFDAALVRGEDISWISVNQSKPGRKVDGSCILVYSTNHWANAHIDDDRGDVLDYLCQQTSHLIAHDVTLANHKVVHGWRCANIDKQHRATHLIDQEAHIGVRSLR